MHVVNLKYLIPLSITRTQHLRKPALTVLTLTLFATGESLIMQRASYSFTSSLGLCLKRYAIECYQIHLGDQSIPRQYIPLACGCASSCWLTCVCVCVCVRVSVRVCVCVCVCAYFSCRGSQSTPGSRSRPACRTS